jgi:hypothetical protein
MYSLFHILMKMCIETTYIRDIVLLRCKKIIEIVAKK